MKIYILGAGIPTPTASRFGSAYALRVGKEHLMFDCGPATTHKLVKVGFFPTQIDHLFFTHHHSDHNADYPCFLLCRWDHTTSATSPLKIWGPPRTTRLTERLIGPYGAFSDDIEARTLHKASQDTHVSRGGTLPRPGPSFEVTDIAPGFVTQGDGWSATAARVKHVEPWLQSLGYRVDSTAGSVVFTGDNGHSEELGKLARGADTLVVNVWDHQETYPPDEDVIAGTIDAATLARDAGVRRLVIAHAAPNLTLPGSREKAVADIAKVYSGEIIFGEELMCLEL